MARAGDPRGRLLPGPVATTLWLLAAALAGVLFAVALVDGPPQEQGTTPPPAVSEPAVAAVEPVSVQSFDPSGGSGFRLEDDGTWTTQTYTTAAFGQLKPGVGLLVDLGGARELTTVALESATPGLALELRAGDETSQDVEAYAPVTTATSAEGPTVMEAADGGAHRYWLVWVTRLAPSGDGFAAEVTAPLLEGPVVQGPSPSS